MRRWRDEEPQAGPRRKSAGQHPAQRQGISVSAPCLCGFGGLCGLPHPHDASDGVLPELRVPYRHRHGIRPQFIPVRASGSRFRAGRAQHHVYCSGGRTYHDCALPGGSPAHQFPASDQGTVSDTLFSPLCHLHPGHRPGVPLALPLGIRLHQLFSGVFGAGATEVAVRSQPDHCGGDHFYHLERYGV